MGAYGGILRSKLEDLLSDFESKSDTPDCVLAEYLMDCLAAFDKAVMNRDQYYEDDEEGDDYVYGSE